MAHQRPNQGLGPAPPQCQPPPPRLSMSQPPQRSPTRTSLTSPLSPSARLRLKVDSPTRSQPGFALRPTHIKSNSGGPVGSLRSTGGNRPLGPRQSAQSPKLPQSPQVVETSPSPYVYGSDEDRQYLFPTGSAPHRVPSSASKASRASTKASSGSEKKVKRTKSADMLRKLGKGDDGNSGSYTQLSGEDDSSSLLEGGNDQRTASPATTPVRLPVHEPTYPSPRRSSPATSLRPVSSIRSSQSKSDDTHLSMPQHFPIPPEQDPTQHHAQSKEYPPVAYQPLPQHSTSQPPLFQRPQPHQSTQGLGGVPMPRSRSHPMHLYSVPSMFDPAFTRPSALDEPTLDAYPSRLRPFSDPVPAPLPIERPNYQQRRAQSMENQYEEEDIRRSHWSPSTGGAEQLGAQVVPAPTGRRGRSLSDGAELIARQGTLLHPGSSNSRSSQELGVLLGGPKSRRLSRDKLLPPPPEEGNEAQKIKLEASKKSRARAEVDVVLERECVVEGGEVRGRMEVKISGGKGREGMRVGRGKVRVVGFEEISSTSRHIFYHHPHELPIFDPSIQHNLSSSLFASGPDEDGYRLAADGTHSIPFRFQLPLNAGAKGTYTSPNGKGPCVRYVVVGSIKLHLPFSHKRSIAHFYRPIVVLPYLNPFIVLAPSIQPIEAYTEKGLGWSLKGEKGRVELRVGLGRKVWIGGQRLWCEVAIRNDSNRKIKSLSLALLQTVQSISFPQPVLRRKSMTNLDSSEQEETRSGINTQRKKVNEEVLEADYTSHGAGRVTGRGWWTGAEPGESGRWDMSIQIPVGMLTIRRTRLIEVFYTLRVTLNNSIYVDLPVELISFVSMDPPPMPSGEKRPWGPVVQSNVYANSDKRSSNNDMPAPAAKASSTTLHVNAFSTPLGYSPSQLQPQVPQIIARPASSSSTYSHTNAFNPQSYPPPNLLELPNFSSRPLSIPNIYTIPSSSRSDAQSNFSGFDFDGVDDDDGLSVATTLRADRRAQGRKKSLAVIQAEVEAERRLRDGEEEVLCDDEQPSAEFAASDCTVGMDDTLKSRAAALPTVEEDALEVSEETLDKFPEQTIDPKDDHWDFDESANFPTPPPSTSQLPHPQSTFYEHEHDIDHADSSVDAGDTVLDNLVEGDREELEEVMTLDHHYRESHAWDYEDELDSDAESNIRLSAYTEYAEPGRYPNAPPSPAGNGYPSEDEEQAEEHDEDRSDDGRHVALKDICSQEAQDQQAENLEHSAATTNPQPAVERDSSVRVPQHHIPLQASADAQSPRPSLVKSGSAASLRAKVNRGTLSERLEGVIQKADIGKERRASTVLRRESSNHLPGAVDGVAKVLQKKSSFSFATPGSPLKVKVSPALPAATISPSVKHTSPTKSPLISLKAMERGLSNNSVRSHFSNASHPPPLAKSSESDSASSNGHWLESPPCETPDVLANSMGYQTFTPLVTTACGNEWGQQELMSPFASMGGQPSVRALPQDSVISRLSLAPRLTENHSSLDDIPPSSAPSTPSSCHSILPSVRSKIAQLESRDEALRKFSVSGSAMIPPVCSPKMPKESQWKNRVDVEENVKRTPTKRKSYTTALGARDEQGKNASPRQASGSTTSAHSNLPIHSPSMYEYDPLYAPERSTPTTPGRLPPSPARTPTYQGRLPMSSSPAASSVRSINFSDLDATPKLDPFGLGHSSSGKGLQKVDEESERGSLRSLGSYGGSYTRRGDLRRNESLRSTSTSATDIERAFMWKSRGGEYAESIREDGRE